MSTLALHGVSVKFGGRLAVSDIDLEVVPGRVTGLIGPNGAGKTTTFNAICGVVPLSSGRITIDGRDITRVPTHKRARFGIGRTFQRLEVFTSLTVRENIQVGLEIRRSWSRGHKSVLPQFLAGGTDPKAENEIELIIDRLALTPIADELVSSLPTGHARLVELGRALAARPSVLLLDEPASGLDDNETESFGALLHELASNGLGILLVEHDVPLVMRVCSHISVLDFGQVLATGKPEEIQRNESVLSAYLGATASVGARPTATGSDSHD